MSHNPSICIPRVFANIGEARIRKVFDQLNIGKIARIDIVERKNERGEPYNRVFIHFEFWFNTQESHAVRRKLLDGKEVKVVYDEPWFWKVSLNTWTAQPAAPAARAVPHIDWEDDDRRPSHHDDRRAPSHYDDRRHQYDDRRHQYDDRRLQYDDRRQEPRYPKRPLLECEIPVYDDRKQEPRPSQQPRSERPQQKPHKQQQGPPKQKQVQRASTATVPVQASTATVPVQAQLPVAKRVLTKKTKQPITQPAATQPDNLEEGEIVETDGTQLMKDIDELYGDLN
jgi:hypothetical protein